MNINLSLCRFCGCMTKTIQKKSISASENEHYRYECGKCGCKKEPFMTMRKEGDVSDGISANHSDLSITTSLQDSPKTKRKSFLYLEKRINEGKYIDYLMLLNIEQQQVLDRIGWIINDLSIHSDTISSSELRKRIMQEFEMKNV